MAGTGLAPATLKEQEAEAPVVETSKEVVVEEAEKKDEETEEPKIEEKEEVTETPAVVEEKEKTKAEEVVAAGEVVAEKAEE